MNRLATIALVGGLLFVLGCGTGPANPPAGPAIATTQPFLLPGETAMPFVASLDELRKMEPLAHVKDWEFRVAMADSGIEDAPWKLLYALASYTGQEKTPVLADFGYYIREQVLGRIGYGLDYAKPGLVFQDGLVMVDRGDLSFPASTTTQRLYCAAIPAPLVGRYRLRIGPGKGFERVFAVTRPPALCWTHLLKTDDELDPEKLEKKEIAGRVSMKNPPPPDYELSARFQPAMPTISEVEKWYADRDEKLGHNVQLFASSLPGRLPAWRGWEQWRGLEFIRMNTSIAPAFYERKVQLAEVRGRQLRLSGLETQEELECLLLARWWINGKLETGDFRRTPLAKRPDSVKAMRVVSEEGYAVKLPLVLPAWLVSRVKAGDKVSLQVLVSPQGWAVLQDPAASWRMFRSRSLNFNQIALSNRIEFTVTAEMLKPPASQPALKEVQ